MIKKRKQIILKCGKYLRFVKSGTYEYIERVDSPGIVIILALTNDGKVIFTEQYRPPVGKKVIGYPAGLTDKINGTRYESLAVAARRELLEETGYLAKKITKIARGPVASGITSDYLTIFRAQGLTKIADGGGDETENITTHAVPLRRAEQWLKQKKRQGFLIGFNVYAGLYFLKNGGPTDKPVRVGKKGCYR